jgi:hypothetical protein
VASYDLAAGQTVSLDFGSMGMIGNNTARNLTVAVNSITGTVKIGIKWRDQ